MKKHQWNHLLAALLSASLLLSGCGGTAGSGTGDGGTAETSTNTTDAEIPGTAETSDAGSESDYTAETAASGTESPAGEEGTESPAVGTYLVDIEVEDYGTITAELYGETAPRTVENFVALAESGFYNGLTFHRIMDGFMIQGGDPQGNGYGGSDTTIPGEFAANGVENPLSHVRGTLSMARSFDPNSASSQFFIVQSDSTFLDGNYAAFGAVTAGMDVVDAICADAVPLDDNGTIAPEAQPIMRSVTVRQIEPAAD